MEVTEVRVFLTQEDDERLRAYATVTFDNCFVVRDLKIISGTNGLFVAMPSKKRKDGTYKDIAHPIHSDFRQDLERIVLAEYDNHIKTPQGGITAPHVIERVHAAHNEDAAAAAAPQLAFSGTYDESLHQAQQALKK